VPWGDGISAYEKRHADLPRSIYDIDEQDWRAVFGDGDPRANVFAQVMRLVEHVNLGMQDLHDPTSRLRRDLGLWTVVVFGRSVTFAIQNLRTDYRDAFNEWYRPYVKEMASDPLMQYFSTLRNQLLKDAPPPIVRSVGRDMSAECLRVWKAVSDLTPEHVTLSMDGVYGPYWTVHNPDGTIEQISAGVWPNEIQDHCLTVTHLPNPPATHLGVPIEDRSMQELCRLYVAYLLNIVKESVAFASSLGGGQQTFDGEQG
jgi:hypothetical protein